MVNVCFIGRPVEEERTNPDRVKDMMNSVSAGSRIVYYDRLINGALESYGQYLQASDAPDRTGKLADNL